MLLVRVISLILPAVRTSPNSVPQIWVERITLKLCPVMSVKLLEVQ